MVVKVPSGERRKPWNRKLRVKVISRDRTRPVHAIRNGFNRARRVKLGEGRLLRIRGMDHPQCVHHHQAKGEHCFLASHREDLGRGKRMRGHWFSSFAEPSEHTVISMRKPRVGFIRCRWACGGCTHNQVAIKPKTVQELRGGQLLSRITEAGNAGAGPDGEVLKGAGRIECRPFHEVPLSRMRLLPLSAMNRFPVPSRATEYGPLSCAVVAEIPSPL